MAKQANGSTDTLESDFEQVYQLADPQVTQLWYKKVGNRPPQSSWIHLLFCIYCQNYHKWTFLCVCTPHLCFKETTKSISGHSKLHMLLSQSACIHSRLATIVVIDYVFNIPFLIINRIFYVKIIFHSWIRCHMDI